MNIFLTIVLIISMSIIPSFASDELCKPEPIVNSFADVLDSDWFYDSVNHCLTYDLIQGVSDDEFLPYSFTSREVFTTILWRIAGSKLVDDELSFIDIHNDWSHDAINWAYSTGIIKGINDSIFAPERYINIQELITLLYRYADYMNYDTSYNDDVFDENSIYSTSQEYAIPPIKWAISNEIISHDGMSFKPNDYVTRAKLVYILQGFIINLY